MKQWKGIDEFLAVAETGSFSRAAERLEIAVSQVSKRVAELERRLNAVLFDRTTRVVQLTTQGRLLYQASRKALAEFQQVQDNLELDVDSLTGALNLCCVGGTRPAFQMELYRLFLDKYPGLQLQVTYADTMPDMVRDNVDLCLVVGEIDTAMYDSSYHLGWVDHGLIVQPQLLDGLSMPQTPVDLVRLPCVSNGESHWRLANGTESVLVEIRGRFSSYNMPACVDACLNGLGVFMLPLYSIPGVLESGRAVRLLPAWYVRKPIHAVLRSTQYVPAKVILLLEFLAETMAADKGTADNLLQALRRKGQDAVNFFDQLAAHGRKASETSRQQRE